MAPFALRQTHHLVEALPSNSFYILLNFLLQDLCILLPRCNSLVIDEKCFSVLVSSKKYKELYNFFLKFNMNLNSILSFSVNFAVTESLLYYNNAFFAGQDGLASNHSRRVGEYHHSGNKASRKHNGTYNIDHREAISGDKTSMPSPNNLNQVCFHDLDGK